MLTLTIATLFGVDWSIAQTHLTFDCVVFIPQASLKTVNRKRSQCDCVTSNTKNSEGNIRDL